MLWMMVMVQEEKDRLFVDGAKLSIGVFWGSFWGGKC
jgi:hypothetical protein